jgi:DNA-binding NarL/FixJ family response regulator
MARIRILIADDHAVVREGLARVLADQPDLWVVAAAADGDSALAAAKSCDPHVAVLDMRMPGLGGVAAIRRMREECPRTRVLVLSMYEDPHYVRAAMAAGAHGYLGKRSGSDALLAAIRSLYAGERLESTGIGADRASEVELPAAGAGGSAPDNLSAREREIMRLVVQGQTSRQIADALGIGKSTVDTYRARVFRKLGVDNRAALFELAGQHEWLRSGELE